MKNSFFIASKRKNSASLILQDLQSFSQLINFLKIICNYNGLSNNVLLMTMTQPNADTDGKKDNACYNKKALQRCIGSNGSAQQRTYHRTELLRAEHKAKNTSALVGSCIAGQNRTQRRLNTGTAQTIAKIADAEQK